MSKIDSLLARLDNWYWRARGIIDQTRKFAAALVGAAALVVGQQFGVDSEVYTTLAAIATAVGVWAVPNKS